MKLLANGQQKDAEGVIEKACTNDLGNQRVLFLRGVLERSRFKKAIAFETFSGVYALGADTVQGRVAMVSSSLDLEFEVENGLETLRRLIASHPDEILIRWLFAIQCRTHRKYPEEAAEQYEIILRQWNPAPVMVNHTYANILTESLEQPEKALVLRERALSQSQRGWTYQGYGNTLIELKRYEEACVALEKAGMLGVDNALSRVGNLYAKGGYGIDRDLDKAEMWYRKLIAKDSATNNVPVDSYQLGRLVFVEGGDGCGSRIRIDCAKTLAHNEVASGQGDHDAKEFLAWLYSVCGDPRLSNGLKAVRLANELCLAEEDNSWRRNTLAAAYARSGEYGKAVVQQEKAIALLSPERKESCEGRAYADRLALYRNGRAYTAYCGAVSKRPPRSGQSSKSAPEWTEEFGRGWGFEHADRDIKDYAKAVEWYGKAEAIGQPGAAYQIALIHAKGGYGIGRDLQKAKEWSAKAGFTPGVEANLCRVGNLYIARAGSADAPLFHIDYPSTINYCTENALRGNDDAKDFLAWIYATCEDPQFRNGEEATRLADDLCQREGSNSMWRDTLAAAYARSGEYGKAVAQQEIAIGLLPEKRRESPEGKAYAKRLGFYRQGKAFPPD